MQRQIKFRAWNDKEGMCDAEKMGELDIELTFDGELIYGCYAVESLRWKLMQYTGLKDKNGKDIYEGDIVTAWNGNGYDCWEWEIIWREAGAYFGLQTPKNEDGYGMDEFAEHEVIGNIYENPELLARGQE